MARGQDYRLTQTPAAAPATFGGDGWRAPRSEGALLNGYSERATARKPTGQVDIPIRRSAQSCGQITCTCAHVTSLATKWLKRPTRAPARVPLPWPRNGEPESDRPQVRRRDRLPSGMRVPQLAGGRRLGSRWRRWPGGCACHRSLHAGSGRIARLRAPGAFHGPVSHSGRPRAFLTSPDTGPAKLMRDSSRDEPRGASQRVLSRNLPELLDRIRRRDVVGCTWIVPRLKLLGHYVS